jgi:hypothetical protein
MQPMSKKKASPTKRKLFKQAVEETPDIAKGFQEGLKAMGKHSNKVVVIRSTHDLQGSVNIDECTEHLYPHENRWDYAFSYQDEVYFVEVHSAHTREVSTVLKKLQWLKDWLHSKAPELRKLQAKKPYYWIQSDKFAILKTSPQYRKATEQGLLPKPNLQV